MFNVNIKCNEKYENCKNCINYCICWETEESDWDADYQYSYETFEGKQIFNGC